MVTTDHPIPTWPSIRALTRADGTGEVTINGTSHPVDTTDPDRTREQIIALAALTAAKINRPVHMTTSGPDGDWALVVHPDGTVEDNTATDPPSRWRRRRPPRGTAPAAAASPGPSASRGPDSLAADTNQSPDPKPYGVYPQHPGTSAPPLPEPPVVPPAQWTAETSSGWERSDVPPAPHHPNQHAPVQPQPPLERPSFLTHEVTEEPAARGWRGLLTRIGLRLPPSTWERAERADVSAVSQHWPGPRTISILNPKGGAGKTPTTVLLSAVFARYGGAGVLAWDNNQTRGSLGWRTEQGPHDATLLDLLPQADRLLSPSAQAADLAHYVHHQTRDRFDVLRSKPTVLAREQRVEPRDVDAIHAVASKYYRMIFIDSGNDESDPMWGRMIDHTHQIVVVTTTRDDHAEAGALLLEALARRDEHSASLAAQAVVIVTQADQRSRPADVKRVATGYRLLAREVVTIPFEPAMVDGLLRHGSLHPATQRAWLAAAAGVARGL